MRFLVLTNGTTLELESDFKGSDLEKMCKEIKESTPKESLLPYLVKVKEEVSEIMMLMNT
jgi:hypothetical protein